MFVAQKKKKKKKNGNFSRDTMKRVLLKEINARSLSIFFFLSISETDYSFIINLSEFQAREGKEELSIFNFKRIVASFNFARANEHGATIDYTRERYDAKMSKIGAKEKNVERIVNTHN